MSQITYTQEEYNKLIHGQYDAGDAERRSLAKEWHERELKRKALRKEYEEVSAKWSSLKAH